MILKIYINGKLCAFLSRLATLFLCLLLLLPLFCFRARADVPKGISARSCILIEASTGRILYEKDAHSKMPMASTTKIMTGLLAIESGKLDDIISVSKGAVSVEGSSVYLTENEKISIKELVYALMLESANDAAAALAISLCGSVESFAGKMNQKAAELGLSDTSFANPHGLDNENHYTTAYDLARLSAYALENEQFREIVSTHKKVLSDENGSKKRYLTNHNRLLRSYDGIIGVKTGFTKKSGRCLVSAAERDGVRLVCVTLNAPDDWNDHKMLLDYGFSKLECVIDLKAGEYSDFASVTGGEYDLVSCENGQSVRVVLEKDHGKITRTVELRRFYFAPVKDGDVIGRLVWYCDGSVIASTDIVATSNVNAAKGKPTLFERIKKIMGF